MTRQPQAVATVTAGLLLLSSLTGCDADSVAGETPAAAGVSSVPTEKAAADNSVQRNGRITTAQRHFGVELSSYGWIDFDSRRDLGLVSGLRIVGSGGPSPRLTCGREFECRGPGGRAALGPGADEVTLSTGEGMAQVIDHDGTLRRTLDLTATIVDGGQVTRLAWSPDGQRLAILTTSSAGPRVWLDDASDVGPELAYTVRSPGAPWGHPQWSPDGQKLLFESYAGGQFGADVHILGLPTSGASGPSHVRYHSDRHFDWAGNTAWSPDGTRVAVRTRSHITVISAEDGSVVRRRPNVGGWLIWLPRSSENGSAWTPPEPLRSTSSLTARHDADESGDAEAWPDAGDVAIAAIDIVAVAEARDFHGGSTWRFRLAARSTLDPAEHTVAYGVMVDGDGDQSADCQIGINDGASYGMPVEFAHPAERQEPAPTMQFGFLRGLRHPDPCDSFSNAATYYAWSSVYEDGRLQARDYAPDAAWLPITFPQEERQP